VVPEARHELKAHSILVDTCRVKALPFSQEVEQFLADHKTIFVIDQNKDGQMKKLLSMEFPLLAHKLQSVIHFTGTPITAENIYKPIIQKLSKEG
jgi:2-oxoglutarate ferredoxin oxidoreductase subunit alpha